MIVVDPGLTEGCHKGVPSSLPEGIIFEQGPPHQRRDAAAPQITIVIRAVAPQVREERVRDGPVGVWDWRQRGRDCVVLPRRPPSAPPPVALAVQLHVDEGEGNLLHRVEARKGVLVLCEVVEEGIRNHLPRLVVLGKLAEHARFPSKVLEEGGGDLDNVLRDARARQVLVPDREADSVQ